MSQDSDTKIRLTDRDFRREDLICIDADKNIWITRGFPVNPDSGAVDHEVMKNLSGPPYVFTADTMTLYDDDHTQGATLSNVRVIFMHGGRKEDGDWMFSSIERGYPVVETVRSVNIYLESIGEPPVQVVMACNQYNSTSGIKFGDFQPDENIVYAVGETVTLKNAGMSESGKIHFEAKARDFWGLDHLIVQQQINIL